MEVLERDCTVIESGEEELEECQKTLYHSKLHDVDELIQMFAKPDGAFDIGFVVNAGANAMNSSIPSSAPLSLEDLLSKNVTQKPRSLVVLDPATLNQLASSNGCRVSSPTADKNPVASSHNLPPIAPNVPLPPQRTVSAPTLPSSARMITLHGLLNDTAPPVSPCRGPRMRFPAPPPPQAVNVQSPHSLQVRANQVRGRAPTVQAPNVTVNSRQRPPPPYSATVAPPTSNTNGFACPSGPRFRLPAAPILSGPPEPNPSLEKDFPLLADMYTRFNSPIPHGNSGDGSNSTNKSSLPPPNLPLLPETRPETASDSRSRTRPGPASRTQRLPAVPSSQESCISSDMVDLTQDDQPPSTAAKLPVKEKTFPSLIVTARASLKIFSTALINNERLLMDNQIRKVMQMPPSVFTEYLLQQRLLKSEQFCKDHQKPLKLGIYSDPKRFPVSGGYVWIADCCKSGFCSVYAGSIFDKTLQPPSNIIKLMYHWACNTAVHNVLNWVKVDSYIMKTYNTFFRAVCTAVLHEKFTLLGGAFKKIQVGVISIGTHPEGAPKEVKVDIMAVMDPDVPSIRLKVLENFLSDSNKVYESKFRKILEVLKDWVHPDSTIITDFAVDMSLCHEYGFADIVVSGGRQSENNNRGIMDYLRAKIPVMFQNTLGLLSYTIIQQFLDELVWRETWGPFPSRAYDSLVEHIAEITKLPGPDLITKLKRIASEPTKCWKYSVWKSEATSVLKPPVSSGISKVAESVSTEKSKVLSQDKKNSNFSSEETIKERTSGTAGSNSLDSSDAVPLILQSKQKNGERNIYLESYYYGFIEGDPARQKRFGAVLAECALCKRDFLSASSFTNHLIHHALNDDPILSKASADQLLNVCTLCCKPVRDIDRHRKEKHPFVPISKQTYMCRICRIAFKEEDNIVKHMTLVHHELDMPYKCELCRSQTSVFDHAETHFKDFHDKDHCVRCPYCFKIVRFCSKSGVEMTKNQYYFVQHVQKHSVNKLNRKCEKCVLSFTNMATLKQHQEKVHKRSGRFLKNICRLKFEMGKMLMMPLPNELPLPPVTLHEDSFHTLKGKALSSSVVVPEYYAICSCLECDGPMTQNHFSVKMTCTRCSFQSCCANSIREHSARRHLVDNHSEQRLRSQIIGGSALLEKPLYCSYCTYSSSNGNKITKHLSDCGDGRAFATSDKRKLEALDSPVKLRKIL